MDQDQNQKANTLEYLVRLDFAPEVLQTTLDQVLRTLKPDRVLIAYRASFDEDLKLGAQRGFPEPLNLGGDEVNGKLIQSVLQRGKSQSIAPSLVCVPLFDPEDAPFGVIYAEDNSGVGTFGKEAVEWLGQISKALSSRVLSDSVALEETFESDDLPSKMQIWKKLRDRGIKARKIGNLKTAETSLKKALVYAKARKIGGLSLARTLNDLSEIMRLQGREEEAEELIRECLDVVEAHPEIDGRSSIPFYNNLAGLYYAKGQVEKAEQTYCQILERLDSLGDRNWGNAIPVLCNLGTLCLGSGQFERAIRYHDKAVRLATELWGESDPVTQQCMNKLAECREYKP